MSAGPELGRSTNQRDHVRVARLPTGTVTFLFTDIEGSTRLLRELGLRYTEALADHRRLLREAFTRHHGVEVDTQGDAFFVAFARAEDAVAAANQAQQALNDGPIRVRMGVHTGEPVVTEEGYVGIDVHRGARIAAAGHGGQVLLSQTTRDLLGTDVELRDLGEHRLKDFGEAVWIFQLGSVRFPPLKTISNTNLPRPASSFVGRAREVAEVASLLRDGARLVTLSGPGGSGKTRLAMETAADLVPEFPNGIFWVGLAPLRDAGLVLESAALVLGAKGDLAEHIGERELLLLLDNFEQVVEAAPELSALLSSCPNLRLLLTSRELLRISGEVEYRVPPLTSEEAVQLFCARSQLEPEESITELCRRLDDLPLAVELAAARTGVLSPAQILARVAQRLDLLKGGRDAEARQQTLRATIEWSFDLLSPAEQELFARLSIFVGGCTLEAVEEVCEADLDMLQSLVNKSLVRHTKERFWMLETIREYATEQLDCSGEADELRSRHVEFFQKLAESANLRSSHAEQRPELVRDELDNFRAAMTWAGAVERYEVALRIATALEMLWIYTNPAEAVRWIESLLEDADDVPPELRADAFSVCGSAANPAGDDELAERMYEQSLAIYEAIGDRGGIAELLMRLGHSALYRDDFEGAQTLATRSLKMCDDGVYPATEALSLGLLGETECRLGNVDGGMELIAQSADLAGQQGFKWQRSRMLRRLADRALDHGDVSEAASLVQESLRLSQELGDRISVVFALARLARLAAEAGHGERAGRLWGAVEAEEESGALGAWYGQRERFAPAILACAGPELERGRAAGRLLSLEGAVREALNNH
jgi:predicted ATPase/class 3 adenylate cyclase